MSAGVALRQRLQQRLGLLEVSRIKALGEPAVDRCKEVMGFLRACLAAARVEPGWWQHGVRGTWLVGFGLSSMA